MSGIGRYGSTQDSSEIPSSSSNSSSDHMESQTLSQMKQSSGLFREFPSSEDLSHKSRRLLWVSIIVGILIVSLMTVNVQQQNIFNVFDQKSDIRPPKSSSSSSSSVSMNPISKSAINLSTSSTSTSSSKPNVIMILADDLGYSSLGTKENSFAFASPVLNELASSGIIMKNYYAQEVCTPARASLLTGRLPLSIGMQYFMVQSAIPWGLPLEETTMADVFFSNGYRTHMLGKWHLGHYSSRFLPTARGFESFMGMLNGESYYWSKRNLDHDEYKDFLVADQTCYSPYGEDDLYGYSTHIYRDKAIEIIRNHDTTTSTSTSTTSNPLFLFLSFQAVHDPFGDIDDIHSDGIPKDYLNESIYHQIVSTIKGSKRQQYIMSLNIMDQAIGSIIDELKKKGMYDNTYIIFSSDNGGCHGGGGMNGDLRGVKGSLFEGGVKVDAFIHSPLLPSSITGTIYDGLFHVSDWFPTIMSLTGSEYNVNEGFELDGVSHHKAWIHGKRTPRSDILYNYYDNVDLYSFNIWSNGSFAIRNDRYKLIHTFDSKVYGAWYNTEESMKDIDDDVDAEIRCAPQIAQGDGKFTYFLFDLINDPNETNNLYNSQEKDITEAKQSLYDLLPKYYAKSKEISFDMSGVPMAFSVWENHDNTVVPYIHGNDFQSVQVDKPVPLDCF